MLKIQILDGIIACLRKLIQWLRNTSCSVDALRYGALIVTQTRTYKAIRLIDIEMKKLEEEKMYLQDKYDFIQRLKEEHIKNKKE